MVKILFGLKKISPMGRGVIQNVWMSVCLFLCMSVRLSVCLSVFCSCVPAKSTVTFDPMDRVDWKLQGRQNSLRVSFWEVFWTPGPSDQAWSPKMVGPQDWLLRLLSRGEEGQVKNQRGCCLAKVFVALKKLNSSFRFFSSQSFNSSNFNRTGKLV